MFSREDLEKREERELAPYAMRSRQTRGRKHPEEEHPFRGVYQRDRDRVIYSTAFRRLQYKTQVFVNHEGDYYRTRLTHTLEVSQISRTIARSLNLNEDLVEAIALSHDLGHTPFAHSGEEALKKLMKDHGGFEHNRHGLRVVDLLETRYPGFPGLNLTYEVREAIAKHSTTYDSPLIGEFDLRQQPTLEAQIVERADEIAYDSHDLDDGVTAGLVSEADLDKVALWHYAAKKVAERYAALTPKERKYQTVRFLINMEVTDLIQRTQANIQKKSLGSADDVRRCAERVAVFSPELH
ncbi:MAG: deoxyguanosinetriphosphate triphosphohydrolase, partial [Planctomycetes bacterium]|nr:deoxyguanosinetriphosphate triphosphohydrolase [Planctomycetota bacterium]